MSCLLSDNVPELIPKGLDYISDMIISILFLFSYFVLIMLVLASNMHLDSFDNAIRDRIDDFVEFALPGRDERRQVIELFFVVDVFATHVSSL